jgi:multidrug efflux pump subunit AcrB
VLIHWQIRTSIGTSSAFFAQCVPARVKLAINCPYAFVAGALLISLFGTLAALHAPADPGINIEMSGVAWQYQGLPPDQIAYPTITPFECALTTIVNHIEHIEAGSYATFGIGNIFFRSAHSVRPRSTSGETNSEPECNFERTTV